MQNNSAIVYVDANVFLSYLNGVAERMDAIQALFDLGEAGAVELRTSTISLTEVAFAEAEKQSHKLDEHGEQAIDDLLFAPELVTLVEFHQHIGLMARSLMREALAKGFSLKPADAIHLATAANEGASVIYTYDEPLDKYAHTLTGIGRIERPHAIVQGRIGSAPTGPTTSA